jgi:hypothetical protein
MFHQSFGQSVKPAGRPSRTGHRSGRSQRGFRPETQALEGRTVLSPLQPAFTHLAKRSVRRAPGRS